MIGTGIKGDPIDLAFYDYLQTIHPKRRSYLHYNSWYDVRDENLTKDQILSTYEAFKKNLLEP